MGAEKEGGAGGGSAAEERGEQQQVVAAPAPVEVVEGQKKNNKRKRKEVAPFGNYRNYYGYRIGHDLDEDPRLKVMKKEWFEGKACLDIGCNSGMITIHIAKKFHCRSVLGIDIDSYRIEDARWNLRKLVNMEKRNHAKSSEKKVEDKSDPEQVVTSSLDEEARDISKNLSHVSKDLSSIVSFERDNFVESRRPISECYDAILCLSVTKWVHLNWGDEGLITLFSKVWRLLRPGGVFVLEPQPWRSYVENHLMTETTAMNYKTIEIRPHDFQEILLDKIGFRSVEDLTSALSGAKKGFNRPVLAFYK